MRNVRLIMAIFLIQSIAMGSWFPRIPEVQQALGLGPAELAMALLGLPVGVLLSLPFAGGLAARIGARHTIFGGFVLFLAVAPLPALAWNIQTLFLALMLIGIAVSALELGMNVAADAIERMEKRKIMSTCHGFWSLGQMLGSLIGVGFAALTVPVGWSLATVSLIVVLPALALAWALPDLSAGEPAPEAKKKSSFSLPSKALIGLCLFVFGIAMTEGAAADWSAVFLRDVIGSPTAQAGLGYTAFAFAIAAGRFLGDSVTLRHGPVPIARICGLLTMIGIVAIVTSGGAPQAMLGLAILGFGCSVGFPLAVSAAAGLGDRPAAANVAVLSLFALGGFLVGPPMIGFVAEHADLRYGLATLLPALLLSTLLAAGLRPRASVNKLASAKA
ncbi:MFS transporter [Kaistia dalseonensis]|uniref:MFS family permease n=1 Tax=Kaistia dalseonensis TaxID=410840 RepID=A0ABU0H3A7_9HYPH|nr:MFS transporter [Kaistia dalseonensis]MCX5493966.1 MFS transporter [Kaistia dalseonensis]MDQ0436542.1 MFS family permease [Kaistia dalseonensis]